MRTEGFAVLRYRVRWQNVLLQLQRENGHDDLGEYNQLAESRFCHSLMWRHLRMGHTEKAVRRPSMKHRGLELR